MGANKIDWKEIHGFWYLPEAVSFGRHKYFMRGREFTWIDQVADAELYALHKLLCILFYFFIFF